MQKRTSSYTQQKRASLVRQHGQQNAGMASHAPMPPEPQVNPKPQSTTHGSAARASEGVRAFVAAKRAAQRMASSKPVSKAPEAPSRRVMTGAERYSYDPSYDKDAAFGTNQAKPSLKMQTLIRQAKSSGKLQLSSRDLESVPEEVLNMYHVDPNKVVVDFSSTNDAWYDAVELTKFIIADNKLEQLDERLAEEFGALTLLDCRCNLLSSLPTSLSKLQQLTALNLSHNRFQVIPDSVFGLQNLRELDMSHNQLNTVDPKIGELPRLEQLLLNNNDLKVIPDELCQIQTLRKLHLNENNIGIIPPASELGRLHKLHELLLSNNKLDVIFKGSLSGVEFQSLERLDVRQNTITRLTDDANFHSGSAFDILPKLKELLVAFNQLSGEPDVTLLYGTPALQTLDISSNVFSDIPNAVLSLKALTRLDVSNNHIRNLRPDLGRLDHLSVLNWDGNPLRSVSRNMTTADLMKLLRSKLVISENEASENKHDHSQPISQAANQTVDYAGDYTAERTADQTVDRITDYTADVSAEPTVGRESATVPSNTETVKTVQASGNLDFSRQNLSDLSEDRLTQPGIVPATIQLHHNEFTKIPTALNIFANTLVNLNLEYNRLSEISLTLSDGVFASLKTLNVSHNKISSLTFMDGQQSAFPKLTELNISFNSLTSIPANLPELLPSLRILRANTNRIDGIVAESFQGLEVIDLSYNDISSLPPPIGLISSIRELSLYGNRFRVPRPALLDQGTGAVMEFLRRRCGV